MTKQAEISDDVRTRILQEPDVILEDIDVMRALISANDRMQGENVIDLRGVAMTRLESRLQNLELTHQSVIAAAFENLSGMAQVHRAILAFLEPLEFREFLGRVKHDLPEILSVDAVALVLESNAGSSGEAKALRALLTPAKPGFVTDYFDRGRVHSRVRLRQASEHAHLVYGEDADWVRSEACLALDLGEGRLPGMLAFASRDPDRFAPSQGTDLLEFMGAAFERTLRRWLEC